MECACDGEADFESEESRISYREYDERADIKNTQLQDTAESMRLYFSKDNKVKDDKPLAVVDTYVKENNTELVDPFRCEKEDRGFTGKKKLLN